MANVQCFCDYFEEIENIKKEDDEFLFYRGIKDSSFSLCPGIVFDSTTPEDEAYHSLLLEYPDEFDSKSHLSTLAKMQHYGLSTRLLDVSDNVLTALYMAVEAKRNVDGKVVVFKVKKREVLHHNSDRALMLSSLPPLKKEVKDRIKDFCELHRDEINEQMIANNPDMKKFLHEIRGEYPAFETAIIGEDILSTFFVQANKESPRMKVQSGYFAIFGLDLDKGQHYLESKVVKEIIIPGNVKEKIRKELEYMNVRYDTIYPDLERTALNIRGKKFNWGNKEVDG